MHAVPRSRKAVREDGFSNVYAMHRYLILPYPDVMYIIGYATCQQFLKMVETAWDILSHGTWTNGYPCNNWIGL